MVQTQREHRTKLKELKSLNHSTQQEQTRTQDYNNKKHKALDQKTQDHDPATSSLAACRTLVVTKPLWPAQHIFCFFFLSAHVISSATRKEGENIFLSPCWAWFSNTETLWCYQCFGGFRWYQPEQSANVSCELFCFFTSPLKPEYFHMRPLMAANFHLTSALSFHCPAGR